MVLDGYLAACLLSKNHAVVVSAFLCTELMPKLCCTFLSTLMIGVHGNGVLTNPLNGHFSKPSAT